MGFFALLGGGLGLLLPVYLSNMLATVLGGGKPIDGGRDWSDGRRILGDGKTWRGLIWAPIVTTVLFGYPLHLWGNNAEWLTNFGDGIFWVFNVYFLALGALIGDAGASFFKRRLDKPRGAPWIGVDQLDFIAGAYLVSLLGSGLLALLGADNWWFVHENFVAPGSFWVFPLIHLLVTPIGHVSVNVIAWKIGFKNEPW